MKLFLCSHFSSVGSLIKEEIENKKVAFIPTASLREGYTKDDGKEVVTGMKCGLSLVNYNDIQEGDVIETFTEIEVEQKL